MLDKNFVIATAVLAACGAGVSLAGAVVDGLMANTYWLQMDICADRSYNFFGTGLGSTDALNRLDFCGNWLYSGTTTLFPYGQGNAAGLSTCGTFSQLTTGTAAPTLTACTGSTGVLTQAQNAGSCAQGFSRSSGAVITASTNICATSNYWTRLVSDKALVCVRNNGFNPSSLNSNTLTGTCYSNTIGSNYNTNDAARLYQVLAASCAFSAINCATAVTLCILCSMVRHKIILTTTMQRWILQIYFVITTKLI